MLDLIYLSLAEVIVSNSVFFQMTSFSHISNSIVWLYLRHKYPYIDFHKSFRLVFLHKEVENKQRILSLKYPLKEIHFQEFVSLGKTRLFHLSDFYSENKIRQETFPDLLLFWFFSRSSRKPSKQQQKSKKRNPR